MYQLTDCSGLHFILLYQMEILTKHTQTCVNVPVIIFCWILFINFSCFISCLDYWVSTTLESIIIKDFQYLEVSKTQSFNNLNNSSKSKFQFLTWYFKSSKFQQLEVSMSRIFNISKFWELEFSITRILYFLSFKRRYLVQNFDILLQTTD